MRDVIGCSILMLMFFGILIALLPGAIDKEMSFREELARQHLIQAGGM